MSTEEFAGIGFAPGVVRGVRSFTVDKLGRLTGIHYPQVWVPGENGAECRKRADDSYAALYAQLNRYTYSTYTNYVWPKRGLLGSLAGGSTETLTPPPVEEPKPLQHAFADCACGFYAYYDGSDDYHDEGRVTGVVEGYGETLIGTRGFRAMKARIVALRISDDVPFRLARLVARNYASVPQFGSFEDMISEFQPDGGELEVTPDRDPDFWTRTI